MNQGIQNVLLLVPVFLFSLCVHEFAHAWTASKKGDPTPQLLGRLTLHPMAHADIVGTLLLPIFCIYYGWPFFGWAKPVPIDARHFKNPRRDLALVAAAGPASNILLALISTALLALWIRLPIESKILETVQIFSAISIQVNLMLAFFNLIPLPPLDGFNVLQGFLSPKLSSRLYEFQRYSNVILIVLLFSGGFRYLAAPVMGIFNFLLTLAGAR